MPMDQGEGLLAERFQAHHPRLRAVAYQMLGSLSDADDAVQEAWLRVSRAGTGGVDNLGGWLTTVVARVCLDMLRSRAARREEPLGVHLPDPVISQPDVLDPEQEALLAEGRAGAAGGRHPDRRGRAGGAAIARSAGSGRTGPAAAKTWR